MKTEILSMALFMLDNDSRITDIDLTFGYITLSTGEKLDVWDLVLEYRKRFSIPADEEAEILRMFDSEEEAIAI